MSASPLISIVVPVYNGSAFVKAAVTSLLNQSIQDLEIIIIDDGSTDNSWTTIQAITGPQIRKFQNKTNQGVSRTRNRGIQESAGQWVGFLDYDDLSHPARLETQLKYLERNPHLSGLGTLGTRIDAEGEPTGHSIGEPMKFHAVRPRLLFENNFILSSMLFKRELLTSHPFNPDFEPAEDYNLLTELQFDYQIENIPEKLTFYRRHEGSISLTKAHAMQTAVRTIILKQLKLLHIEPSAEEYAIHQNIVIRYTKTLQELDAIDQWLQKLTTQNHRLSIYNPDAFGSLLKNYWHACCIDAFMSGFKTWKRYRQSPFTTHSLAKSYQLLRHLLPVVLKHSSI